MSQPDHAAVLASIQAQHKDNPLSIINLAEPLLSTHSSQSQPPRIKNERLEDDSGHDNSHSHNDSSSAAHSTTAALIADLDHYRSLFSKLRFSYLEQVTKEKYLRSIVGEPPLVVTHEENAALEDKLAVMKAELKAKKEVADELVKQMEVLARDVAVRQRLVDEGVEELQRLPGEIERLGAQVEELRATVRTREAEVDVSHDKNDPRMDLGLQETRELVEEQRRKEREIREEIERLQRDMPGKVRECEKVEQELAELEVRRNEATRLALEVRAVKERGGRDVLEEQGRWYESSDKVLRALLEIES